MGGRSAVLDATGQIANRREPPRTGADQPYQGAPPVELALPRGGVFPCDAAQGGFNTPARAKIDGAGERHRRALVGERDAQRLA